METSVPQTPANDQDAFRIQIAAVVAQQAALDEQETRLMEERDHWLSQQRDFLSDAEGLILRLLAQEEHFERRQQDLRSREAWATRLEQACGRLARDLEAVQQSLNADTAPAFPRIRAA